MTLRAPLELAARAYRRHRSAARAALRRSLSPEIWQLARTGWWMARDRWFPELYEAEVSLLPRLVRPGDLAFDIGASMGQFSVPLSRLVGPSGRVVALEPSPAAMRMLRHIASGLGNLDLLELAASDSDGARVMAHLSEGEVWEPGYTLVVTDRERLERTATHQLSFFEAKAITVDALALRFGRPADFIKCDVQGHERQVLSGAAAAIAHGATWLLEIEDGNWDAVAGPLLAGGYRVAHVRQGRLRTLDRSRRESNNYLFSKRRALPPIAGSDGVRDS